MNEHFPQPLKLLHNFNHLFPILLKQELELLLFGYKSNLFLILINTSGFPKFSNSLLPQPTTSKVLVIAKQ